MKYILASASPRRRELLQQIGLQFEVIPARGEEVIHSQIPEEVVMDLSRQKAEEIAAARSSESAPEVIIGADTVVSYEGRILGKPKDMEDAYQMISRLQGKSHRVYTGVTLIFKEAGNCRIHSFYEETQVTMSAMTEEERHWYVATKEPMDKAGGYGIQGCCAVFVEKIQGDYNNVVGLPVAAVYRELRKMGIDIYREGEEKNGRIR